MKHPTVPIDRLKLAINIDMIGRLRQSKLTIYGAPRAAFAN